MKRIWAIAINTHRENVRDRVLYSILFFAALVLITSLVAKEVTIGDSAKVVRGVAQGSIRFFGAIIAMFLGVGLVWKELDRKTIYNIVSKPIPRWMFVLGKYLGLLLTLAMNMAMMLALYVVIMLLEQGYIHPSLIAFSLGTFMEMMLITAWATLFSSYSGPTTATAFTMAIFAIGNMADNLWLFGQQAKSDLVRELSTFLYWVLPTFGVFNVQPQATHEVDVSVVYMLKAAVYCICYCTVVLAAAMAVFQRRDFK